MTSEAHVRIDEGVKRGPNALHPHKPVSPRADLGSWQIPANLNANEVLQEYLTATTTSDIAARYGLSRKALTKWLRTVAPNEWKVVQVLRALDRKENADNGLETAPDALSLARARELLRSAQFDLERLDASTWGQKQEVTHQVVQPILQIIVVAAQQSVDAAVLLPDASRIVDVEQSK